MHEMQKYNSPWLHQLKRTRAVDKLFSDLRTDVAVVGAGIAGIMTAYFILKYTSKEVALIEAGRVAHGATGHNAGQIVFEFEREFYELVEDYGLELAADAERLVRNAWILLEEIYRDANLTTPMSSFMGYNGYATVGRIVEEMKNNALRLEAGLQISPIYISDKAEGIKDIPSEYKHLYSLVPHENLLALLETEDTQYVAVMSERKGCVNSALLVEEIVGYLLATYKGRFILAEESPVREVVLERDNALLKVLEYSVVAKKVVLCTNGFEKFTITNMAGGDIDVKFHHMVQGDVGYMAGYLEEMTRPPMALSFFDKEQIAGGHHENALDGDPYIYMTRRPYELEKNEHHNLICVGGPEHRLVDARSYQPEGDYIAEATNDIEKFLHKTYDNAPKGDIDFKFQWHGLMGYTPTSLRVVGEEPKNPVLMYNLGCNGVGILTSIYGSKRISQILSGEKLAPSLFDPRLSY